MMKTRKLPIITSLVLVALLVTTGMVFADDGPNGQHDDGTNSTLAGQFSTVSGGENNKATANHATVGGGGGEFGNTASGVQSTVSGGSGNSATDNNATVGGGFANSATGFSATIGGGSDNIASAQDSTVGGGHNNEASGEFSTVGGGNENDAIGPTSTVGGGSLNTADGGTVGGGVFNDAIGEGSTVGGGNLNTADGIDSTVGGGVDNDATGRWSTIPGGRDNMAAGDHSFAAGHRAQANDNGTFVWADSTDEDFTSTGDDQFLIRASGGVGIGTNSPNQLLVIGDDLGDSLPGNRITIGNTGTSGPEGRSGLNLGEDQDQRAFILWHNDENYLQLGVRNGSVQENDALVVKDRRVGIGTANPTQRLHVNGNVRANQFLTSSSQRWKTNIQTIAGALEKVESLRGVSYDWKADGKHDIGLIAEEVGKVIPEVVAYEENGKDATAVDYAKLVPVLIEGMKEQQQMLEDRDGQITAQQQQIVALQARMTTLEESLGAEAREVQTGLLPFSASLMWMMVGGLGLVLATPGLVLGYRRIRKDE